VLAVNGFRVSYAARRGLSTKKFHRNPACAQVSFLSANESLISTRLQPGGNDGPRGADDDPNINGVEFHAAVEREPDDAERSA
jgi:hypothetical protein